MDEAVTDDGLSGGDDHEKEDDAFGDETVTSWWPER